MNIELTAEDLQICATRGCMAVRYAAMEADERDYRAMLVEMASRYDWHDGETASERNERTLRNAL